MKRITIICGPTASGKSALAVRLAMEQNGIVINADSMQVYNALPLLTAQPSADDYASVPHRLYATISPHDKCSAQIWRDDALREIDAALDAGKHPIIVGGTGLYIKALTDGLSAMPVVSDDVRAAGNALQAALGNPGFHAELMKRDPVMATRLNPNDTQRLIRAWEIIEATGQSLSVWQAMPLQGPPADWRFNLMVLTPDRALQHERCDRRFDQMMALGALEEVAAAMPVLPPDAPVSHALGYRPLAAHLRGEIALADAITLSKQETRQYVKRQDTWFRNQIRTSPSIVGIEWIA